VEQGCDVVLVLVMFSAPHAWGIVSKRNLRRWYEERGCMNDTLSTFCSLDIVVAFKNCGLVSVVLLSRIGS
jgi:hypothetical protein